MMGPWAWWSGTASGRSGLSWEGRKDERTWAPGAGGAVCSACAVAPVWLAHRSAGPTAATSASAVTMPHASASVVSSLSLPLMWMLVKAFKAQVIQGHLLNSPNLATSAKTRFPKRHISTQNTLGVDSRLGLSPQEAHVDK